MLARFLILLASAATAFAAAIPSHGEGSYTMHPAGSDAAIEYCLAVDGKPSDGSPVVVRQCNNSQSQGWSLMSNMRGLQAYSTWRFQFGHSRFCLTGPTRVAGANGTTVIGAEDALYLTYCMDSDQMRFNSYHGTWKMKGSEQCIELPEAADGSQAHLGTCNLNAPGQLWVAKPADESQMYPFE